MAQISVRLTPAPRHSDNEPSGISVRISDQGFDLSKRATVTDATPKIGKVAELKSYLRGVNFENISPDGLTQLAAKLYESGLLPADRVIAFHGIEGDTVDPMDPLKKINVIDHFKMMYNVVSNAAQSDSSLDFGVSWRKESIETLNALRSFATSDRDRIL
jgi:hypothetical protein